MARRTRITKAEARERIIDAVLTGEMKKPRISVSPSWFSVYLDWDLKTRSEVIWGTYSERKHGDLRHLTEEPSTETIGKLIDIANEIHWRGKT